MILGWIAQQILYDNEKESNQKHINTHATDLTFYIASNSRLNDYNSYNLRNQVRVYHNTMISFSIELVLNFPARHELNNDYEH